jgi:hypothetical protein
MDKQGAPCVAIAAEPAELVDRLPLGLQHVVAGQMAEPERREDLDPDHVSDRTAQRGRAR